VLPSGLTNNVKVQTPQTATTGAETQNLVDALKLIIKTFAEKRINKFEYIRRDSKEQQLFDRFFPKLAWKLLPEKAKSLIAAEASRKKQIIVNKAEVTVLKNAAASSAQPAPVIAVDTSKKVETVPVQTKAEKAVVKLAAAQADQAAAAAAKAKADEDLKKSKTKSQKRQQKGNQFQQKLKQKLKPLRLK